MTSSALREQPERMVAVLADAARQALRAPSTFNTQPWRWRVAGRGLELFADRDRQLAVVDPEGRLLVLSCGAALHHARVALAAAGHQVAVERFCDYPRSDLLARITVTGRAEPAARDAALATAITRRRTDRRPFGDTPVPADAIARLRTVVEAEDTFLHVVRPDQMPMLAVATMQAAAQELTDPAYRAELIRWTNRPAWSGDGVPAGTAVEQGPRRVPVRDFALGTEPGLRVGDGRDRGATYAILFGSADEPGAWLRAGEALSALLLTAVVEGLSGAPFSDAVEMTWPRRLTTELLAGIGKPYLLLRLGTAGPPEELPPTPRRPPAEVIEIAG